MLRSQTPRSSFSIDIALAGSYRRTTIPPTSQSNHPTGASAGHLPCIACNDVYGSHVVGYCPLKLAGVELCNLCGLAHYGIGRACPHMNSETQVSLLLRELKESPEPKVIVDRARQYLSGVKGDLVSRKKKKAAEAALLAAAHFNSVQPMASDGSYGQPPRSEAFSSGAEAYHLPRYSHSNGQNFHAFHVGQGSSGAAAHAHPNRRLATDNTREGW